ncbi:MAG: hypothetical protein ABI333_01405 [bacterium]
MSSIRLCVLIITLLAGSSAVAAPAPAKADPPAGAKADPPARAKADPPARAKADPPARAPAKRPRLTITPSDVSKPPPDPNATPGGATAPGLGKPQPAGGDTPKEMTPPIKKKNLSHRLQVSIDIAFGVGYSLMVVYDTTTTWCGKQTDDDEHSSFCPGLYPPMFDFALGFGVHDNLDILAEFRLGVMNDNVGNKPILFMPGIRLWIDPKQPFKIGISLQVVLDFTKQDSAEQLNMGPPPKGTNFDVGARFAATFQYDFVRYFGIFARVGLTSNFMRWVQINLEGQIGVQTRFP